MSINAISTNDFNKQLYMMMTQEEEIINNENENVCLITNNKLTENFVKLCCGHKFNYEAIFNEVKKQKIKYNHLEVTRLKRNEIKCPYCRTIQTGLLPYVVGFEKIKYVNHPEALQCLPNKCTYIFVSGKKKKQTCGKGCSKKYCTAHEKIMLKRKKKLLEKKQKELLNEKKELTKKIQNVKIKLAVNDPMITIIDNMLVKVKNLNFQSVKTNVITCNYIFKRGKNKGQHCKCKKIFKNGLCKMHYNMSQKKISPPKNQKIPINIPKIQYVK